MITKPLFKPNFYHIERVWENQPAYVVAGGPSLIGFNFNRLKGKNVVAVKGAAYHLPWASCYFSMDIVNWNFETRLAILKEKKFQGEIWMACGKDWMAPCNVDHVKFVIRDNEYKAGLSYENDRVSGHNSGFAALNFAFLRGANPIYLLGLDLVKGGYWYAPNDPRWVNNFTVSGKATTRDEYIDSLLPEFFLASDDLFMYGVECYKNPGGPLDEFFETISLEKI